MNISPVFASISELEAKAWAKRNKAFETFKKNRLADPSESLLSEEEREAKILADFQHATYNDHPIEYARAEAEKLTTREFEKIKDLFNLNPVWGIMYFFANYRDYHTFLFDRNNEGLQRLQAGAQIWESVIDLANFIQKPFDGFEELLSELPYLGEKSLKESYYEPILDTQMLLDLWEKERPVAFLQTLYRNCPASTVSWINMADFFLQKLPTPANRSRHSQNHNDSLQAKLTFRSHLKSSMIKSYGETEANKKLKFFRTLDEIALKDALRIQKTLEKTESLKRAAKLETPVQAEDTRSIDELLKAFDDDPNLPKAETKK